MEGTDNIMLTAVAYITQELIDTSESSESDDEELVILEKEVGKNQKREVPRVLNYVELTVPAFTDEQFKVHFRYYLGI